MRITVVTSGSRGDVQPYVALGAGLAAAGHNVRLAGHAEFETWVRSYGLDFAPLAGNPRDLLGSPEGQRLLAAGANPWRLGRGFLRILDGLVERSLADGLAACAGSDAVIFSLLSVFGHWVAEKLRVPSFAAYYLPLTPTRWRPSAVCPPWPRWLPWGRCFYNRLTYAAAGAAAWWPLRGASNRGRRNVLGLPPLALGTPPWRTFPPGHPYLYGFSRAVFPPPADWDTDKHVTGYWFLDRPKDWRPPPDLEAFLEAGSPPVYVGFGSMNDADAAGLTDLVVAALARAGRRGVLATGWGGLKPQGLPGNVLPLGAVPHDWLFPRMAAVVHHGGAGTTSAGLRAGVPAVVVPFMSDQPFWGRRVFELGAGPRPVPRKRLSEKRLAEAISAAVTDPEIQKRAANLREQIQAEDGVGRAVEVLHDYLGVERLPGGKTRLVNRNRRETLPVG